MKKNVIRRFDSAVAKKPPKTTTLRLETLESRELLSVAPGSELFAADALAVYESRVASSGDVVDISDAMLDVAPSVPEQLTVVAPAPVGATLTPLAMPTLTVEGKTGLTIAVSWNAVPNAERYSLSYKPSNATTWTNKNVGTNTNYTVSGLALDTSYDLRVKAIGDGVNYKSVYSPIISATTNATPAPSETPMPLATPVLSVAGRTGTTITVNWGAVDNAERYSFSYKPSSSTTWTNKNVGTNTSYTITGLDNNTSYDVRVKAIGDGETYKSVYSSVVSASTDDSLTPLATPVLTVAATTPTKITISWDSVANAERYSFSYKLASESTWTSKNVGTDASYTITGLTLNTEYDVRVKAIGDGVDYKSVYSPIVRVATSATPIPLDAPILTFEEASTSSLTIAWNAVDNAERYSLSYKPKDETAWTNKNVGTDASYTITGLTQNTEYDVRVKAIGDGVDYRSVYSSIIRAATLATLIPLDPPVPTVEDVSTSSLTIAWDAVDNAERYSLSYKRAGETAWTSKNVGTDTNYTITRLTQNTEYDVRVKAIGDGVNFKSSYSEIIHVQTLEGDWPHFTTTEVSNDSILLYWNAIPNAVEYCVAWAPVGSTNFQSIVVTAPTSYAQITGLVPNTEYQVKINVSTRDSTSEFSPVMTLTTTPADTSSLADDSINYHRRVWMKGTYPEQPIYGDIVSIDGPEFTIREYDGSLKTYLQSEFSYADRAYLDLLRDDPAKLQSELERAQFRQNIWPESMAEVKTGAAPDLDVLYISRTPGSPSLHGRVEYVDGFPKLAASAIDAFHENYYLEEGTPVVFSAMIANHGDASSGSFNAQWKLDGVNYGEKISCASLSAGEQAEITLDWTWENGAHTITLELDVDNMVEESCKWNNQRTDAIQGAGFVVSISDQVYNQLCESVNLIGSKSPEDFLQWHMDVMNQKLAESCYPSAPDGCLFRVRLDKIIISTSREDYDEKVQEYSLTSQGNWLVGPPYDLPPSSPDWGLIHEWGHQLGLIDYYRLDCPKEHVQVTDDAGRQLELDHMSFPDVMMHNHGANPFCEVTVAGLNRQITEEGQQTPRGYYGDYLFAMCDEYSVRALDRHGLPLANAQIDFYQRSEQTELITDNGLAFTVQTDSNGVAVLPNRPFVTDETTGGFAGQANPFGKIDVVGRNGLFLIRVRQTEGDSFWTWLEIVDFCVPYYRGEQTHTFELQTPFSALTKLETPSIVSAGAGAGNTVSLTWSASENAAGYAIRYKSESDDTFTTIEGTAESELVVSHLLPGVRYCFMVQALGDDVQYDNSAWSEEAYAVAGLAEVETPSLQVNSIEDVVDCYDQLTTLREAIEYAKTVGSGPVVTFANSLKDATIVLNGTPLEIDGQIEINALALYDDAPGLAIDANGKSRVFTTTGGTAQAPVQLRGLTIQGGKDGDGAGIFNRGAAAELILERCVIKDCVSSANGGALLHDSYSTARLYDVVVEHNEAQGRGGGVYANSPLYAENCRFVDNHAKESGGGLSLNYSATLRNVVISHNTADLNGGGVVKTGGNKLTIYESEISDNEAKQGYGGGLYATSESEILGSTVANNAAFRDGGGVFVGNGTSLTLKNTIVALNRVKEESIDAAVETTASLKAYNTLSSFSNWTNGANNFVYNASKPLFTNAASGDYTLAANSQVLNKGNNQYVTTSADLAGNTRIVGGTVDLGAYERQTTSSAVLDLDAEFFDELDETDYDLLAEYFVA